MGCSSSMRRSLKNGSSKVIDGSFFVLSRTTGLAATFVFSSRAGHFLTTARSLTTGISSVMACRVLNSFRNFDFLESISSSCESSRSACNSFSRISFAK